MRSHVRLPLSVWKLDRSVARDATHSGFQPAADGSREFLLFQLGIGERGANLHHNSTPDHDNDHSSPCSGLGQLSLLYDDTLRFDVERVCGDVRGRRGRDYGVTISMSSSSMGRQLGDRRRKLAYAKCSELCDRDIVATDNSQSSKTSTKKKRTTSYVGREATSCVMRFQRVGARDATSCVPTLWIPRNSVSQSRPL